MVLLVAPVTGGAFELPPVQQGTNLADCASKLDAQGGGWCEIRHGDENPTISSVWPENQDKNIRMVMGPYAVLIAWNGAAFDEENSLLYFMGGGHTDYGGNEVYEFDLNAGRWTRLTDPSPLTHLYRSRDAADGQPAMYCWTPDLRKVPGASHTYDGIQFSNRTRTFFLAMMGAANGACFGDAEGSFKDAPNVLPGAMSRGAGIYEFNPSRNEARNGLDPLTWRRLDTAENVNLTYPRSLELPDGRMLVGDRMTLYEFDPTAGKLGRKLWGSADYGDGLSVYHPSGRVMTMHWNTLVITPMKTKFDQRIPTPTVHGKSVAIDRKGILYTWDGKNRILTLDPNAQNASWRFFNWAGSGPQKGDGRVYSKWQYVSKLDVFVGLSSPETGVWVYKHPAEMKGVSLDDLDPQKLVDEAKPGSTVVIPPGTYSRGLVVKKSLTLKLKGAHLWGVAEQKGVINVKCDGCKVVIEDLYVEGRQAGCLGGNCSGIKAEGIGFDLTLKRAVIDNPVMGVLTDNRGGRLVIEDSLIENTGLNDGSNTIAHGLYAGEIDQLTVRRSTIRNVNSDGHLLKSRAKETELEDVRLLAEEGFHSRSIDLPCGGKFNMTHSVMQHGKNTDNPDVIAIGTEPKNCAEMPPTEVSIRDSWLIIDRHRTADERARTYGPNFLFRWRGPVKSVKLEGNHIVNLDEWSTADVKSGDVVLPDLSTGNEMCRNRADCGLGEREIPEF